MFSGKKRGRHEREKDLTVPNMYDNYCNDDDNDSVCDNSMFIVKTVIIYM